MHHRVSKPTDVVEGGQNWEQLSHGKTPLFIMPRYLISSGFDRLSM